MPVLTLQQEKSYLSAMKWRKMKILLGIISALIIGACSVNQQVFIKADASGSVRIKIELKKAFINYLVDLAEVMGESFEGNFFNIEEIKKGFEEKDGVELKQIDCPRPETLEMQIQFRSVEELFSNESQLRYDSILSFDHTKEGYSLRFLLDRSNFRQVSELFPLLKNPLFEALGPQESDTTTEEEYLELIELASHIKSRLNIAARTVHGVRPGTPGNFRLTHSELSHTAPEIRNRTL